MVVIVSLISKTSLKKRVCGRDVMMENYIIQKVKKKYWRMNLGKELILNNVSIIYVNVNASVSDC